MPGKEDVLAILQIGVIGLGFLLAVLAYHLLTKEQKQNTPRSDILKSIYVFMSFSVVLCIIGIVSQVIDIRKGRNPLPLASSLLETNQNKTFDGQNGDKGPQLEGSVSVTNRNNILYNYFVYSDDEHDIQLCNISEFVYSEKLIDTDNISIEGKITGKVKLDNRLKDFERLAFGNKNKYYLKIIHDEGVAFLEQKNGDYIGYWIGEVNDPEVNAVICPVIFSPNAKGLSVEDAKNKWPILNRSCRPLYSLKDIL